MTLIYFRSEEFYCPCGCSEDGMKMDQGLLASLDFVRHRLGEPVIINSGFRCGTHNIEINGHPESKHLRGEAADIRVTSAAYRFNLLNNLLLAGFIRIGIGKTFIHVESISPSETGLIWVYDD